MLAISEAVCRHREAEGIDGPLFLGRDTHALSEPATRTIVEVLGAHGVDVVLDADDGPTPTPVISHAILTHNRGGGRGTADGIVVTPVAQPARRRRLQVQPAARRPGRHRRHGRDRGGGQRAARGGARRRQAGGLRGRGGAAPRLRHRLRRRPRRGDRPRRDPRRRPQARRRPARRREPALLGGDRRAPPPRPRDRQRRARPDLPLRAARLGRQDPHGLLLALRDGAPDRPQGPLRRRLRQRPRRRPPRHRHAVRGAAEPQPPPRRLRRLPVRRRPRVGGGRRRRQDGRELEHDRPRGRRPRPPPARGPGRLQVVRRRGCSTARSASAARRARARRSCAATARSGRPTRTA